MTPRLVEAVGRAAVGITSQAAARQIDHARGQGGSEDPAATPTGHLQRALGALGVIQLPWLPRQIVARPDRPGEALLFRRAGPQPGKPFNRPPAAERVAAQGQA